MSSRDGQFTAQADRAKQRNCGSGAHDGGDVISVAPVQAVEPHQPALHPEPLVPIPPEGGVQSGAGAGAEIVVAVPLEAVVREIPPNNTPSRWAPNSIRLRTPNRR